MATYKELRAQRKKLGHTEYHEMIQNYSEKAGKLDAAAHEVLFNGLRQVWEQKKDKNGIAVVTERDIIALSNEAVPRGVIPAYCGSFYNRGKTFATKTLALHIGFYGSKQKIIQRYIEIDENGNQIGDVIEKEKYVNLYGIKKL